MKKKTIYIVKFTSQGFCDDPRVKFSKVHNRYAIITDGNQDIKESVEKYRLQEEKCVQDNNKDCKVKTSWTIVSKTVNIIAFLKA
jgi:hypothetical protein